MGFRDCILANAFRPFSSPHKLFTSMPPKLAQNVTGQDYSGYKRSTNQNQNAFLIATPCGRTENTILSLISLLFNLSSRTATASMAGLAALVLIIETITQ